MYKDKYSNVILHNFRFNTSVHWLVRPGKHYSDRECNEITL